MNDLRNFIASSKRHEAERYFSEQARSQYLGNDTLLCKVLGDKKMFAIASDVGLSPHLVLDGYWEYWLTLHFATTLKPGDTVIDVGANLGYYTVLAADLVGGSGTVVSVEPNPAVFSYLIKTIAVNGYGGRVSAFNYAISDERESQAIPFFVPTGEPKNGRFLLTGENADRLSGMGELIEVAVGSLQETSFSRIDLIKIDVEGAELKVLRSLRPLIDRFSPQVVCEVNFQRGYGYEDVQNALGVDSQLQFIDYDGLIKPLTRAMASEQRKGDDWIICHNHRENTMLNTGGAV